MLGLPFELVDFGLQVSSICELHYNAQSLSALLKKRFLVADNVWVLNRGQNADFIKRVFFLFLIKLA